MFRPALSLLRAAVCGALPPRVASLTLGVAAWYFGWGVFNSSVLGPLQPESVVFFCVLGLACGRLASASMARHPEFVATPVPRVGGLSRPAVLTFPN